MKYILLLIIGSIQIASACTNCYIPVAHAGDDVTYFIGCNATLDGTLSYDPEENDLTYLWTSNDENIILDDTTSSMPSFSTGDIAGSYSFSLVVNDGEFNSDPVSVTISVVDVNQPPVIDVENSFQVNKNSEFTIDAGLTNDTSSLTGQDLTYDWVYDIAVFTLIENNQSSITLLAYDVSNDESHDITLNVSDGFNQSSEIINVNIIANQVPVAVPGEDQLVKLGAEFTLDGTESYDPDDLSSSNLTYTWNIPDDFTILSGYTINDPIIVVQAPADAEIGSEAIISLTVFDGTVNSNSALGQDLFISEYCEGTSSSGSSNVRYIEIYNPTDNTIDLNNYTILNVRDGLWSEPDEQLSLNEEITEIEPGESILINRRGSSNSTASQYINFDNISENNFIEWSDINLRGDDAIAIAKNGILIDAIGVGVRPAGSWEVAGENEGTKNAQLIRKDNIITGNINNDCMTVQNENEDCWNISRGSSIEDSEWIVKKDPNIDPFNNAGFHYCATCDNYLTITLTDNATPTASIHSDFVFCEAAECDGLWVPSWTAVEGSSITLDATSSSDPEGSNLFYTWSSSIVSFSDNTSSMPLITVPIAVADNFIDDIVLVVSDGVNQNSISIGINTTSQINNSPPFTQLDFVSMSNGEFSYSMNSDFLDACLLSCDSDTDCENTCNQKNLVLSEQTFDLYEGYEAVFSAENSYDQTYTGELYYTWDLVDLDDIEINGINSSTVSFTIPEYIGSNQSVKLRLTVGDGAEESSTPSLFADNNLTFIARMPILSVSTENEGLKTEGELIRLDAGFSNDPLSSNLNDLFFTISSSPSLDIVGYCANNINIPCTDNSCESAANYCLDIEDNAVIEQSTEMDCCLAGCIGLIGNALDSCNESCQEICGVEFNSNNNYEWTKCSKNKSIAFTYLDKSIGESIEYTIDFQATKYLDNSQGAQETLDSAVDNIQILVNPYDPVPSAGYRYETSSILNTNVVLNQVEWYDDPSSISITENTEVILDGSRSYDPQLESVSSSYWSDSDSWETPDNPLKIISFYDLSNGLSPKEGYTYTWEQIFQTEINAVTCAPEPIEYEIENFNLIENQVNPIFTAPILQNDDSSTELSFNLTITDGVNISHKSSVSITIVDNLEPTAVIGDYRIYNDGSVDTDRYLYGHSSDSSDAPDTIRALVGTEFTLVGENSHDDTPYQGLTYSWTAPDGILLSDIAAKNPTFEIPSDLCSDNESLTEIDCCVNNGGDWSAMQTCEGSSELWTNEKSLEFSLIVFDGELSSSVATVPFIYSAYSMPVQPSLYATTDHGKINLYWDNISQNSIDDLSKYADFEGYKIYKSTDYGQTWGDAIYSGGVAVGWKPYVQYDFSAEQDSTYCLYKNDFLDCMIDEDGDSYQTGAAITRYDDVSGNLDWYEGYYWQDLGDNSGIVQSFVDEDVIDGVDYTYSITAYDRGIRPDTLQYGHFGSLSSSTWDDNIWSNGTPVHTFKEVVEADSFYFHKMNYNILESYIDSDGSHMYRLEVPTEWNVGQVDEIVSQNQIDQGVEIWDVNTVWPISNPDEFPYMYSLESMIGSSVDDRNFITVTPGFYASNVSFPGESDLEEFIAADCEAVGDGSKFYEIVNEADLTSGYIKLEIYAESSGNAFENYKTKDACLYAYRVEKTENQFAPDEYLTLEMPEGSNELDGYLLKYLRSGTNNYIDGVETKSINTIKNLPGFSQDEFYVYLPDYLIECHELSYLDDPDLTQNWTEFFDGIRMRLDNSLRKDPKPDGAALKEIYSVFNPESAVPDSTFAKYLTEDQYNGAYGQFKMKYASGAFDSKPPYEYELEFYSTTFPDTARFNTTGGNANDFYHLDECGTTFGTLLPFRVKNTTTGKYVKIGHTDNGIWNGEKNEIPPSFQTPDDLTTHPGYGDCVWSPGEWLTFQYDEIVIGNGEPEESATYVLQFRYDPYAVEYYKSELCSGSSDYDQTVIYPSGSCIEYAGNVWFAQNEIKPSDNNGQGFLPNEWYPSDESDIESNINPWKVVYPWNDGDRLVVKPQKWFVDGDYWIADMSMLGASVEVTESNLSEISVVPNPYIVSSKFNESTNSNRLRFTHLPKKCTIKIFTISGELVDVIDHDDDFDGNEYWDLKNDSGKKVSPGLYIYHVESNNGISKTGKFAIVR